jgi:hypothetical protein
MHRMHRALGLVLSTRKKKKKKKFPPERKHEGRRKIGLLLLRDFFADKYIYIYIYIYILSSVFV